MTSVRNSQDYYISWSCFTIILLNPLTRTFLKTLRTMYLRVGKFTADIEVVIHLH